MAATATSAGAPSSEKTPSGAWGITQGAKKLLRNTTDRLKRQAQHVVGLALVGMVVRNQRSGKGVRKVRDRRLVDLEWEGLRTKVRSMTNTQLMSKLVTICFVRTHEF